MLTLTTEQRTTRMLEMLNLEGPGIEYGPLYRPLVTKNYDVKYVDYASKQELVAHYAKSKTVKIDQICEVDVVTRGERIIEFFGKDSLDYVVASHVAEHVPDLVGWLADNLTILKPGGRISLAYPDKRFTFDIERRTSTLAELTAAFLERRSKPNLTQLADHYLNVREVNAGHVWANGTATNPYPLKFSRSAAMEAVRNAHTSGSYVDCHCWIFHDVGFVTMMAECISLFKLPMRLAAFHPTLHNTLEFFVTFEKASP